MVITRTPFRMSFFGGGTDFPEFFRNYGGSVLSATFDKYCYVTLRSLPGFFDYESEFVYSRIERVHTNREILHPAIRNAMIHWEVSHVRLNYEADLPARTGLGTSSSFAVGMLHAIHAARGETVDKRVLADEAIYLERTLCGECGGWQDQIAASFGGLNRIDFYGDGYTVRPVEMPAARKAALSDSLSAAVLSVPGTAAASVALPSGVTLSFFPLHGQKYPCDKPKMYQLRNLFHTFRYNLL